MKKISIFSITCSDLFPFDIAHRQFKKYMKEDFDYIIFNDAFKPEIEKNINTICSIHKIDYVKVPQNIHGKIPNPSECFGQTLNWIVREHAAKNDYEIIVLMHSDILPICEISIENILGDNIAASTVEFRIIDDKGITYFYPALTVINMKLLKNPNELDFGLEPGLDVGGKTQYFIKNNADKVKFIANYQAEYMAAILEGKPIAEYFKEDRKITRACGLSSGWVSDGGLYHFCCGSQWNLGDDPRFAKGHQDRMALFLKYFY